MTARLTFHYNSTTHRNWGSVLDAYICWWKETAQAFGVAEITVVDPDMLLRDVDLNKARRVPPMVWDDRCDLMKPAAVSVLVSMDDGEPLETFEHPPIANYVFGHDEAGHETLVIRPERTVRISTPINDPLWQIVAAGIVLYDRHAKKTPDTLPGAGRG